MAYSNAARVTTDTIQGTSIVYTERSLAQRRCFCKIFFLHKIINGLLPVYLQSNISYAMKKFIKGVMQIKTISDNSPQQQKYLGHSFFPIKSGIILVRSFGKTIVQSKTKFSISSDPPKNQLFKIHDTNSIKLLNNLRLHFSHF